MASAIHRITKCYQPYLLSSSLQVSLNWHGRVCKGLILPYVRTSKPRRAYSAKAFSRNENMTKRQVSSTQDAAIYIIDVKPDLTSRYVSVTCSDGHAHSYPFVWLRDNCQCERCYDRASLTRSYLMEELNVDVSPQNVQSREHGKTVEIVWDDGHVSQYGADWLLERAFTESAQKRRKTWYGVKTKTWDASFQIPENTFEKVMTVDQALYEWIRHLGESGLFLLTGAPSDRTAVSQLAERVAFLRKTNYGETFTVESKEDPSNIAYTSLKLGLHTDLPYYKHQPGVQLLHCIEQCPTEGGENVFTDGCHVAEQLRAQNPEYFEILTTTLIDYVDRGTDLYKFHKLLQVPVIVLDYHGNVEGVRCNQHVRDSFMTIPLEKVEPFYRAFKHLNSLLYDPQNTLRRKLKPGEIICFNNTRVLHGREAYTLPPGGRRLLSGGYLDWDEMYSRMRVLQEELYLDPR